MKHLAIDYYTLVQASFSSQEDYHGIPFRDLIVIGIDQLSLHNENVHKTLEHFCSFDRKDEFNHIKKTIVFITTIVNNSKMYYKLVSPISIHVGVSLFISVPEHKTAIIIILLKWDSLLCLYCFCLSPLQSTVTLTTVIVTNTMTRHIVLEYDITMTVTSRILPILELWDLPYGVPLQNPDALANHNSKKALFSS